MVGLQGKCAKPAPRASASYSKSARAKSTMAAANGNGSRSRASSSASERPERLSLTNRGPSPYTSKLTTGVTSGGSGTGPNTSRRVQSAVTSRQKSALGGPTVKASEFFRKNHSEPQLSNNSATTTASNNVGKRGTNNNTGGRPGVVTSNVKNVKHVRIDTDRNFSTASIRNTLNTATNLLGIHGTNALSEKSGGPHPNNRRPFSFCSDRSRSVSVTSNDSCSTLDSEILQHDGSKDGPLTYWRKDRENNNTNNFNSNKSKSATGKIIDKTASKQKSGPVKKSTIKEASVVGCNPRLNKRSYSMDTGEMDFDQDDHFWNSSPTPSQDFQTQRLEMKIAEHPEEQLQTENVRRIVQESVKSRLNRTFTEDLPASPPPQKNKVLLRSARSVENDQTEGKSADFDRLLLMQSDNLLQGVNDLIKEIKSTETSKKQQKSSSELLSKTESVEIEKLVADLRNDINKQMFDSSLSTDNKNDTSEHQPTADERFNFSTLSFSGIELSDITCPIQVMEQSVPNTGRFDERPLSAVVLGNNGNKVSNDIISEAESYLLRNRNMSNNAQNKNNNGESYESSSDSNNQIFSSPEALSIIQQQANNNGSARSRRSADCGGGSERTVSSNSQHSGFDISQEDIQRKICSALKLLEEESERERNVRRASLTSRAATSARSQSPYCSASNPDSRSASRVAGEVVDSTKSSPSPRVRSEERNIPYDSYDSHPVRNQGGGSGGGNGVVYSNTHNERNRILLSEPQSARSCSCLIDRISSESLNSARSSKTTMTRTARPGSGGEGMWEAKDDKTKQIFSFLDEVEKSDQEMLFGLRFETDCLGRPKGASNTRLAAGISANESVLAHSGVGKKNSNDEKQFRTMDTLIRKGSVELAREILMLERKLDEAQHAVKLLEESLLNQRELNIRNLRNSERDFKKRMKMQKEEFDLAFSRNEALINEMVTEKRVLQDRLDKLIKNFEDMEEKHKEHAKAMQQKHLDEIRRMRKMQQNAESSLKKSIAGNKTQANEIREMTVKGLEPEVQRIIQRHQQEMSEMRAWHADEVREIEERYQRKLNMQLEDLRQKFAKEKEDLIVREIEQCNRRFQVELKQRDDEMEGLKRRHANEMFEERERSVAEEVKLKDSIQESVRKAQIKGEVELENLKQDYEAKLTNLERKHESELKSVKDVYEAERQNWATNQMKRLEQALSEQEAKLKEAFQIEKEKEWREKERKLKEDLEKSRKDDEVTSENRFRRMQEKYQQELNEMEKTEKDVKSKFSQAKTDLLAREEEVFSLKASISMKDKQLIDLQELSMKLQEERVNLTSVIRREFMDQIQTLEEECRSLKASIVEIQSNGKLQIEQKQLDMERVVAEKDSEIEKIGLRVKQALSRKDETILELQKQLEKSTFQISHLEELLEEQRKEFLHGITKLPSGGSGGGRGHRK